MEEQVDNRTEHSDTTVTSHAKEENIDDHEKNNSMEGSKSAWAYKKNRIR